MAEQMEDLSERYCFNPVLRWNSQVEEYFTKAYGAEHFALISKALTRPSCYSCIRVNTLKSTTDTVIKKLSTIVTEMGKSNSENTTLKGGDGDVNGIELTQSGSQKASVKINDEKNPITENFEHPSISRCQVPGLDYVVFVRGSGPHTIDYGYANGRPPKEVIVSRKCAEAVLRGAQVYVPGVMACSAHVEKGDVVAISVAVEQPGLDGGWSLGITRGTVVQGLPTDPYHPERSGLYIGQGTTAMSRAGIFRVCEGVAVDMHNRVFKLPSFYDHELRVRKIFLQNLPSIVTAHALGRNNAIAILMKDGSTAQFCIGGLIPVLTELETLASLKHHAKYQRRMFDQAVQLVRPGGVIVYSTCTINPGENEALVRYALDTYKFLTLAPQHPRIGGPGLVGRFEFADHSVEEWLRPGEEHLVQRFDPSSPLDTIGFFIAKFSVGSKDSE
ncbi:putative methyltransferase NSUN6 [Cucurbita argyrosperma subsp. argyrosperma]|nr:putative methyltransferase NSUN6 [Cucurbita argyrosperma subsp. argyrosperma]